MPQPSISKICLKIKYLKFYSNFPGANEFNKSRYVIACQAPEAASTATLVALISNNRYAADM